MKHLKDYFLESENIEKLKNHIKNNVDKTTTEDALLLKKIDKMLETKGLSRKTFDEHLKNVGLDFVSKTLLQKIDHYNNIPEFIKMYNEYKNDKNVLPSITELLGGSDIYELVNSKLKKFDIDEELIKELSFFEMGQSGINKGKFEIFTQLFFNGINKKNENYKSKHGDINGDGHSIEYKLSGARIAGQGTLEHPNKIYTKLKDELKYILFSDDTNKFQKNQSSLIRLFRPNEIEKLLNNYEKNDEPLNKLIDNFNDCFQTKEKFEHAFNAISELKINDKIINTIIAISILEQIPNNKYKIQQAEINNFIDFVTNKDNAPIQNNEPNYKNLKYVFGAFHMYLYQHIEKFDYMLIFKTKGVRQENSKNYTDVPTGKYIVLKDNCFEDFETIKKTMESNNIKVGKMISYGVTREYAITISCK